MTMTLTELCTAIRADEYKFKQSFGREALRHDDPVSWYETSHPELALNIDHERDPWRELWQWVSSANYWARQEDDDPMAGMGDDDITYKDMARQCMDKAMSLAPAAYAYGTSHRDSVDFTALCEVGEMCGIHDPHNNGYEMVETLKYFYEEV